MRTRLTTLDGRAVIVTGAGQGLGRAFARHAAGVGAAVVVNDVPLLAEKGYRFPLVIVVQAPLEVRIERLARDRGMSREEAESRIAAQATDEQRRAIADVVIDNDGTLDDLRARVDAVWNDVLLPARAVE